MVGRKKLVVGAVIGTILLAGGVAWAAVPDANGVIHGCRNTSTGALRVIDTAAGQTCTASEAALNWGQRGLNYKGAWSNTTAYAKGDVVLQGGSSWYALAANTGKNPSTNPTLWGLIARAG